LHSIICNFIGRPLISLALSAHPLNINIPKTFVCFSNFLQHTLHNRLELPKQNYNKPLHMYSILEIQTQLQIFIMKFCISVIFSSIFLTVSVLANGDILFCADSSCGGGEGGRCIRPDIPPGGPNGAACLQPARCWWFSQGL
jgi:hypothetical protein